MNVSVARQALVAASVAVTAAVVLTPSAQAEEISGVYNRAAVHRMAAWISEHNGMTNATANGAAIASAACGPAAPVCAGLAYFYASTWGMYGDTITKASDHNACVYEYAGDTRSGSDGGGFPYLSEINDGRCHN